ncbi:MAG: DoxX-like family protein, partial [Chthoniobacterales bacterium]
RRFRARLFDRRTFPDMNAPPFQIARVKLAARAALGLIWIYEGLVPKFLFLHADQLALVARSGLVWRSPEWTLHCLGAAQVAMGLWLLAGWPSVAP